MAYAGKIALWSSSIIRVWLALAGLSYGNLVRVHEELLASGGTALSYAALTAFCRAARHRLRAANVRARPGTVHTAPNIHIAPAGGSECVRTEPRQRRPAKSRGRVADHSRNL